MEAFLKEPIVALLIICIIWGVGELISYYTKSIISSLFVASVVFLVGFQLGLPKDMFLNSSLLAFGAVMIGVTIIHLGTMISIEELKSQWKTVVIALSAVLGVLVFVLVGATPFVGLNYSLAATGPISGGTIAAILVTEAAIAKNLPLLGVFATVIITLQGFIGYPISSIILKKEAQSIVKQVRSGAYVADDSKEQEKQKSKLIKPLPPQFQTTSLLLAKIAVLVIVAWGLELGIDKLTGITISRYVICLFLGVIFQEIGFLEKNILDKSNSFGIIMMSIMVVVFASLANANVNDLIDMIYPLIVVFFFGVLGIMVTSMITGKMLGYSVPMSIVIGLTALYGFPGTMILTNEVATSIGETEEEKKAITQLIMPKMVIAGFVTVTISSVLIAGIVVQYIA